MDVFVWEVCVDLRLFVCMRVFMCVRVCVCARLYLYV